MTLDISVPEQQEISLSTPKITVIGIGGAGGNAINNMINSQLSGVNFVAANTDAQALGASLAQTKIQLGLEATKGQGAGANPDVGRESAEEAADKIAEILEDTNMVFITAGMGGGTGTGAAPVFAKMARDKSILTVGVVTKPFIFEGRHREAIAEKGIEELAQNVDTLIVISNQNLFYIADEKMSFMESFKRADQVLQDGVRSITDLIITPGVINLDFSDVRTVMTDMGRAMMGIGESSAAEKRAITAAEEAITNPLLDNASMTGAKGILINIAGGSDLTLIEVDAVATRISEEVDPEANIIFGASFDEKLEGSIRVSVVATGLDSMNDVQNIFKSKQTTATPLFAPTSTYTKPKPIETPVIKEMPAIEPVAKENNSFETDEYVEETIAPVPTPVPTPVLPTFQKPVAQKAPVHQSSSSILSAMPPANELFGGETRQPAAFENFVPKPIETKPVAFEKPVTFEKPVAFEPPAETFEHSAPQPVHHARPVAQEDLFAPPAPVMPAPVMPEPVKPVKKDRVSLRDFITGKRNAEPETNSETEYDEDSDIPPFLRQS